MEIESMLNELLTDGADDWLMALDVAWVAKSMGGARNANAIRELSMRLIRELIVRELAIVGDVDEHGFQPWSLDISETLDQIGRRWASLSREPTLGDVCWLDLTPKGELRAAELLRISPRRTE
jgi:hypothetical protein